MKAITCRSFFLSITAITMFSATAFNVYAGNKSVLQPEQKCLAQMVQKPDSLYQDNFDGTVTDVETALIWQKCSLGYQWKANKEDDPFDDSCVKIKSKQKNVIASRFDWTQAQDEVLSFNEKTDGSDVEANAWRIPEADELMSLTDAGCSSPSINARFFPATQNTLYWTGTELEEADDKAYLVYFSHASQINLSKDRNYAVRLVQTPVIDALAASNKAKADAILNMPAVASSGDEVSE